MQSLDCLVPYFTKTTFGAASFDQLGRPCKQLNGGSRLYCVFPGYTNLRKRKQPDTATHTHAQHNKDDQRADTQTVSGAHETQHHIPSVKVA